MPYYSKATGGFYDRAINGDNIPTDAQPITSEQHQALLQGQAAGKMIVADATGLPMLADPVLSQADRVNALVYAIQRRMDAEAAARGYDDLKTAITYRGDPNPRFAAEAEGFFVWRSAVWTDAYARLASGNIPATPEAAIALMPALVIKYPSGSAA